MEDILPARRRLTLLVVSVMLGALLLLATELPTTGQAMSRALIGMEEMAFALGNDEATSAQTVLLEGICSINRG